MASQLTVRGVSAELNSRLLNEARTTGKSVNSVALRILESAVGINQRRKGLVRYMTWSWADRSEFEASLKDQRGVDHDLWR